MADFTITVSNSLALVGATPPSLWGTILWGDNWGSGTEDFITSVGKLISNSQSWTTDNFFAVGKFIDSGDITLSDLVSKGQFLSISNTQSITGNTDELVLKDGSGYDYIFTKPTTDAENRSDTTWTSNDTGDVATWTCNSAGSTTWTES